MTARAHPAGLLIRGCLIEGQCNAGKSTLAHALIGALRAADHPSRLRRVTMTDAPVLDELHRLSLGDFDGWTLELALRRFNVCQSARLIADVALATGPAGGGDYLVYDRSWWGQLLLNDFFTPDGRYLPVDWVQSAPQFQTRVYLCCDRQTRAQRARARSDQTDSRLQVWFRDDLHYADALDAAALARIDDEGGWRVYHTGRSPLVTIVDDLVRVILDG